MKHDSRALCRAPAGDREDRHEARDAAVGDESLRAVDHVVVAIADGRRPHRGGIGAGLGLGEAEADEDLAGGEIRHPPSQLLRRAAEPKRQRAEVLDGEDQAARGAGPGDLFDGKADREEVASDAAVLDRERERQHVLRGEELPDVLGEFARSVDLGSARGDPGVRQLADGIAEEDLVLGQPVTERLIAHRAHRTAVAGSPSRRLVVPCAPEHRCEAGARDR
jgi:hypothetical protein